MRELIELTHKRDGRVVIAIGLDISNAFNSLQWADICSAMREKRFPEYLQLIIYNYLSNRELIYVNKDGNTVTRAVEAWVLQGSVLGPLLWNLTFDKVLRANTESGCRLMAYDDDTMS